MSSFATRLQQAGCITDVPGIRAGHARMADRATGCTVILTERGAIAAVDVRGAAPGTRETDLLAPGQLVEHAHAIALCGGSAYGLAAATGVMQWLEERGWGLDTGYARVPIVPAAVLYDLLLGDARIRPDAACGWAACEAAWNSTGPLAQGNAGAGSGAVVGKMFGLDRAMRGGIGSASLRVAGVTVGAVVACNAVGDVRHGGDGRILAGARQSPESLQLCDAQQSLLAGVPPLPALAGANTTIGVIATDAPLSKVQAQRLAMAGHDGLARTITPVHTMSDGDTLFALATGQAASHPGMMVLAIMAAEAVALATVRAVLHATPYAEPGLHLPAAQPLAQGMAS
ncbi:peptidase S58 family protein [Allofranklinella schreckenbergeri]|uniref:Peptidase S58 family protein n=1 Tax=Allofranklinella schreckenbergeri TaxID=1076744 RepID=A0A3M6R2N2_9BURK|nr:P1 family peptidase [Allofranklinella schreckenbergeri]RMX09159.1 peptidase S58 family protein [Allofranklinella schreckenbergeri]